MDNQEIELKKICRTCQSESDDMESLFVNSQKLDDSPRIDEMLMACTSLQVSSEDGLPSFICKICTDQLHSAYAFRKQCEKSDASLRELYHTQHPDVPVQQPMQKDYIQILDTNQLLLTCCTCFKMFTTLDGLRCHKRLHTGDLFKCKLCDKEYTRLNHLQRHELSHGRRKAHMCKICNKTLTRFEHLKRHLVTHLKEKPYSCNKCLRGFNRSEHLINHTNKCKGDRVYLCDICNKAFNREDSLEVHKKLHENKIPILPTLENLDNIDQHYLEIDLDEKTCSTIEFSDDDDEEVDENDMLDVEIEIKENVEVNIGHNASDDDHPSDNCENYKVENVYLDKSDENVFVKEELGNEEATDTADEFMNEPEEDAFVAEDRDDSDSVHSEYLPHTKSKKRGRGRPRKHGTKSTRRGRPPTIKIKKECTHKEDDDDEPCELCEEDIIKKEPEDGDQKLYSCETCNKIFPRLSYLKRHMMSHNEEKPFICELCKKGFSRKDHLNQHMKSHVKGEYECDECKKVFTRADHLTRHKNCKHNGHEKVIGEKKFKCTVCLKGFTTEKYREVHMRSHTGEKIFQCKSCEKAFISKSHLTEHMKFHNDNSKKFLCSECGQRFIRNDYLVIHMRRHRGEKPFKCQYCGKGFPRTTDLTVHERYHTGEKTHLCTICGRGFGRAYNLTVHMRTHTGEKPYQCTYCDAAFAQGNDLKAHIRRHTGERFQCELCTDTFLMGYLLTQHKRNVHGLNVVSNIRRLQPVQKINPDDPPITIPLPAPVIPANILQTSMNQM